MIMLDASFVVAYFNTRDQNHERAKKVAKTLDDNDEELYITDYIFGKNSYSKPS